jgi:hypothetical protein
VVFCSTTFGAGVNASHCPITCPKRQLPVTLCAMWAKIFENILGQIFTKIIENIVYNKLGTYVLKKNVKAGFKMKKKLVLFFMFLLVFGFSSFSCFAQSSSNDQRIVGTWVDVSGNTLVFNANGSGSWAGETFTYGVSVAGILGCTEIFFNDQSVCFSPDGRTVVIKCEVYRKR